jgi:hypothetical protein
LYLHIDFKAESTPAAELGSYEIDLPTGAFKSELVFIGSDFGRGTGELGVSTDKTQFKITGTTPLFSDYILRFTIKERNQVFFEYTNFLAIGGSGNQTYNIVSDTEKTLVLKEAKVTKLGALEIIFTKKAGNLLQIDFIDIPLPGGTSVTGATATLTF